MRVMAIIMTSMFLIVFLFSGAFAQDNPAGSPLGKSTKIMLAVEGNEYPAILHANAAARDFISRLPLAVSLSQAVGIIAAVLRRLNMILNRFKMGIATASLPIGCLEKTSSSLWKKRKPALV